MLGVFLLYSAEDASQDVLRFATALRHHVTAAWCVDLAGSLIAETTGGHARIIGLASLADAAFSFVEGWCLHRRYWWSRWLIVAATASLVPLELVALARHRSVVRAGILVVNVAVVVYLAHRGLGRRERHFPGSPSPAVGP